MLRQCRRFHAFHSHAVPKQIFSRISMREVAKVLPAGVSGKSAPKKSIHSGQQNATAADIYAAAFIDGRMNALRDAAFRHFSPVLFRRSALHKGEDRSDMRQPPDDGWPALESVTCWHAWQEEDGAHFYASEDDAAHMLNA